ncbi:MAG: OmpA family protein [Bacteroidia bacterium]|nr:OmpA family protein [Bacteroidia bacterium]
MSGKKDSFWIPYADLMTVLMLIFLFISLSYMAMLQIQSNTQNKLFKDFKETKIALYKDLETTLKNDMKEWALELDSNLSIRFTNPSVLFSSGSSQMPVKFKNILNEFLPKYLSVIIQEKYKNKISEIRIEGHTDTDAASFSNDPYITNIQLSQDRARAVLALFRSLKAYKQLDINQEQRLQFWLTANGLSYGRTLDKNKKLTMFSGLPVEKANSRRVEFRIVTSSEALVEEVIKGIENN